MKITFIELAICVLIGFAGGWITTAFYFKLHPPEKLVQEIKNIEKPPIKYYREINSRWVLQ